jgi:DNA-binding LacI/PurR family transcriptional regulator
MDVPKHQIGIHAIDILVSDDHWKSDADAAFSMTVPTQLIVRESSVQSE